MGSPVASISTQLTECTIIHLERVMLDNVNEFHYYNL